MSIKLKVGIWLDRAIDNLVKRNYQLTSFIPNGRLLPLDLKRAGIFTATIFDVGANIGQSANYFHSHFPDAEIYSFEPVKATYQQLIANIKGNPRIHAINEGLGSAVAENEIFLNDASGTSSLKGNDGRFFGKETVKINTGKNFCEANQISQIDLLKIDVEGFELDALNGFGSILQSGIKMIYAEVGFDREDAYKTYINDLLDFVSVHGFIMSGFYEPYRWGKGKLKVYYNVLLTNTSLIEV